MAYEFDVFLSYPREDFGPWVQDHLLKFLRTHLQGALSRMPKIFIDSNMEIGTAWPPALQDALAQSRCLVGVWAPRYFASAWCRFECGTMLERQEAAGGKKRLVWPVVVSDGNGFPAPVRQLQWLDCSRYFLISKGFELSQDYLEFEKLVKSKMPDLAGAIESAPRWRKAWLHASKDLPHPPGLAMAAPTLG
jgi:TIR domain-containing protein